MERQRKTEDQWVIQQNWGYGEGWEDVDTSLTRKEAEANERAYRKSQPAIPVRMIMRRVPKEKSA